MSDDTRTTAIALDAVVADVAGVVGVYAAEPALVRAAKETLGVIVGTPEVRALVSVKRNRGAVTVETNIAVAADAVAPDVAAAVRDAVTAALPALDAVGECTVTVRVIDVRP